MKLLLAPMDSITHQAFRNLVERFGGCDEYFNEMINASSLLNNGPWEKFYLLEGPKPEKFVWQLTDKNGEKMALAAGVLAERGGIGVDLNMGCSAPQIANTGAGIAWMTKPISETQAMVHGVKSALENSAKDGLPSKRLSVKLRLGDQDFTLEKFFEFTDMLVGEGVQMLSLHPRTKKEKYRERARWNFVEELALRYPQIPVNLNGDVKDTASFEEAQKAAPHANGIMIARAAVQKPWIFAQLRAALLGQPSDFSQDLNGAALNGAACADESPSAKGAAASNDCALAAAFGSPNNRVDLMQTGLDYIALLQEFQPKEFFKSRMQRFFSYYCDNFTFGHYIKMKMLNAATPQAAEETFRSYFDEQPSDRFKDLQ